MNQTNTENLWVNGFHLWRLFSVKGLVLILLSFYIIGCSSDDPEGRLSQGDSVEDDGIPSEWKVEHGLDPDRNYGLEDTYPGTWLTVKQAYHIDSREMERYGDSTLHEYTVENWGTLASRRNDLRRYLREKEQAPFDPENRGDVAAHLVSDWQEVRDERRRREFKETEAFLVERFGGNEEGRFRVQDAEPIFEEIREYLSYDRRDHRVGYERNRVSLMYFDYKQRAENNDAMDFVSQRFEVAVVQEWPPHVRLFVSSSEQKR
ncbi:MAG: hypothetical protein LAT55_10530 [Opitutales bacterium]|nr:hypothetical protein [Opitutales bacterium]